MMSEHAEGDCWGESLRRAQVLSRRQVAAVLGVSTTTLWRMVRRREFPAPIRLSRGRVGWRRVTVEQWLAAREAASVVRRTPAEPDRAAAAAHPQLGRRGPQ